MSDNANLTSGDGTLVVATDKIAGVDYQRVKVTWGTDGTATDTSVSAPLPVDTQLAKAEDAAHSSGDSGVMVLGVRKDTAAALAGTDGDYIPLIVDSSGRLWVQVGASALPSGAATAAKQPALGTAGSASADVLTVQGIASMTPLKASIDQTTPGTTDSVTVATGQGAGATIGATSGAAVVTDADGTLQQYLRGLVKLFSGASFDNTNVLKVSLYGKNSVAGDTALTAGTPADGDALAAVLRVAALQRAYNGATADIWRNNVEGTALASAARTATTSSADITNYNGKTLMIIFRITSVPGTDTVTCGVEWKNPADGAYYSIASDSAQSTATTRRIQVGLAAGTGGNFDKTAQVGLPRTFRITITHSATSSFTYSVGYCIAV